VSNYTTVRDLHKDILLRSGEVQDTNSDFYQRSLTYLNRANLAVLAGSNELGMEVGEPWPWAKTASPAVLNLVVPYETGTATVTNSSTAVTLSDPPSYSLLGYHMKIPGRQEFFKVTAHTASNPSVTLDSIYTDESGTMPMIFYKMEYALASGILRLITPMRIYRLQSFDTDNTGHVDHIALDTLYQDYPMHLLRRTLPTKFAQVYRDQIGTVTIRFNWVTEKQVRLEYEYIPIPKTLRSLSLTDASINTTTETITFTNHGLSNDELVQITNEDGALPTGLAEDTNYYVISAAANTFKLSSTLGGIAVDITAATGGGTHYVSNIPLMPLEHRVILAYAASYYLMVDKEDSKSAEMKQLAMAGFQSLVAAFKRERIQIGRYHMGRLVPRLEQQSAHRRFFTQEVT
jgi:hypothetical protein